MAVIAAISNKKIPERPKEFSAYLEHADFMWQILEDCWKSEPTERPTARQLKSLLQTIV